MKFIFTFSKDTLTVLVNGRPETVFNTHPKWEGIFNMATGQIEGTPDDLYRLINAREEVLEAVTQANIGRVVVGYDGISLDGKIIHNHLTSRMMEMLGMGIDVKPWALFMEKLQNNPSRSAVNELYLWLETSGMPILPDGNFLGYKKVNDDYTSYHNNADGSKCHNAIGSLVSMTRNEVDDDRNRTCSTGLHFCSWSYLPHYYGGRGKVIMVSINPADVVSIPSDYDNAKGRASCYTVIGEVAEEDTKWLFNDVPVVDFDAYEEINLDDIEADGWEFDGLSGLYFNNAGSIDLESFDHKDGNWTKVKGSKVVSDTGRFHRDYTHNSLDLNSSVRVWFGKKKKVLGAKLND